MSKLLMVSGEEVDVTRALANRYRGNLTDVAGTDYWLDSVGGEDLGVVGTVTSADGFVHLPGTATDFLRLLTHSVDTLTKGSLWIKFKAPPGVTVTRLLTVNDSYCFVALGELATGFTNEGAGYLIASPTSATVRIFSGVENVGTNALRDNTEHTIGIRSDGASNVIFFDGVKQTTSYNNGGSTTPGYFLNAGGTGGLAIGTTKYLGNYFAGQSFSISGMDIHTEGLTDAEFLEKG